MPFANVSEITDRLADNAESVCRKLLPNGYPKGNYWMVGSIDNERGQSLRVVISGPKEIGKWVEEGDCPLDKPYGDLLDLVRHRKGCGSFQETLQAACELLSMPIPEDTENRGQPVKRKKPQTNNESVAKAWRLFEMARPVGGTLAEEYLKARGILTTRYPSMRFHSSCMHYDAAKQDVVKYPALLGAITNNAGQIIGVNRIYLDQSDLLNKPFEKPKRVSGNMLGGAVRFGQPSKMMVVGEGMETMSSVKTALPTHYMGACLTANNLAAFMFPDDLEFLAIARDNGLVGESSAARLRVRAEAENITVIDLVPQNGDFNDDLREMCAMTLRNELLTQWRNAIS
ncbi:MAG: DNA primase [Gammaproteobacteria bacterium]|nr:DNA primase [Gammaproteobacteria bacterium]